MEDVLQSLQKLALHHRRKLKIPIIAITGSNGKTTTKELVNSVLRTRYNTFATAGNLNNHIGVPLTLLSMQQSVEIGIVEMGANHQKEIEFYCSIAEPTHGLITNIGKAHLEGFGGEEGVKKGKGELFDYLYQTGGTAFINSEDEKVKSVSRFTAPVFYYQKGDDYHCELLEEQPFVKFRSEDGQIFITHLIGKYNFYNIAAALCIGKYFKVDSSSANNAVAAYNPQNNRSQILRKDSLSLILDAYNANPSSMKAAIDNFAILEAESKLVIVGDMFELGDESEKEHRLVGELLKEKNLSSIFCGKAMKYAKDVYPGSAYFETRDDLIEWLKSHKYQNTTILIKGSRGMGLEKIVDFL